MKNKLIRALGISLASVTLVASVGTMSMAASQTNGSDEPLHIYDTLGTLISPEVSITWTTGINASSSSSLFTGLTCPAGSTGYRTFIGPRGTEKTLSSHDGYREFFTPNVNSFLNISPSNMNLGGADAVRINGGLKSFGIACTDGTNTAVKAYFRNITVSAGGSFVAAATADVVQAEPETSTSEIPMTATTIASSDGTLSLSVPQDASVTFGAAQLVNNKSTSTGTLPQVTVTDERYSSQLGWSVGASWADFVSGGGNIIGKANLAIVPSIVGIADGVTVANTPLAGLSVASSYTIAEATLNNGVGTTTIGGELTFAAPIASPAGTYTSTLTLTLVSK